MWVCFERVSCQRGLSYKNKELFWIYLDADLEFWILYFMFWNWFFNQVNICYEKFCPRKIYSFLLRGVGGYFWNIFYRTCLLEQKFSLESKLFDLVFCCHSRSIVWKDIFSLHQLVCFYFSFILYIIFSITKQKHTEIR